MKNLNVTIVVMYLVSILIIVVAVGCKPTQWNIEKDETWEIWGSGTISKIETVPGAGCSHEEPNDGCAKATKYTFTDGTEIIAGHIKNPGTLKVRDSGVFYKYNDGSSDTKAWFQWVEKPQSNFVSPVSLPVSFIENNVEEIKTSPEKEIVEVIYEWEKANSITPTPNTIVLVKLKDGIVTTAYILSNGDWKFELYRNKTGGGGTVFNINQWKKIDIN